MLGLYAQKHKGGSKDQYQRVNLATFLQTSDKWLEM